MIGKKWVNISDCLLKLLSLEKGKYKTLWIAFPRHPFYVWWRASLAYHYVDNINLQIKKIKFRYLHVNAEEGMNMFA